MARFFLFLVLLQSALASADPITLLGPGNGFFSSAAGIGVDGLYWGLPAAPGDIYLFGSRANFEFVWGVGPLLGGAGTEGDPLRWTAGYAFAMDVNVPIMPTPPLPYPLADPRRCNLGEYPNQIDCLRGSLFNPQAVFVTPTTLLFTADFSGEVDPYLWQILGIYTPYTDVAGVLRSELSLSGDSRQYFGGMHRLTFQSIPEPATLILIGTGAAVVVRLRRVWNRTARR